MKLPPGSRTITHAAIVRTRSDAAMFRTASGKRGTLAELIAQVGIRLELPQGNAPYLVPGEPILGTYDSGTEFKVTRAAIFTNTSKMPGVSFAVPAGPPAFGGTCPAAALGDDAARAKRAYEADRANAPVRIAKAKARRAAKLLPVLSDAGVPKGLTPGVQSSYAGDPTFTCRSCYALSGNYRYPTKQANDILHLAWVEHELAQGGPEQLGRALAGAIQHANMTRPEGFQPYFRIHDAGDFHTPEYLEAWVVCASLMPHMKFWAPTRQWVFAKWVPLLVSAERRVREAGGTLVIRPSVLRFYEAIPQVAGLSAGSGVGSEGAEPCVWICPVYNDVVPKLQPDGISVKMGQATSCIEANCTACWDQPDVQVSYGAH